ncbi:MAG: helix-turn-helix domain-containing protein [Clostridia bacterium]|nr:helix-turn-helix domain-containing protein [Clostridia bacterium]
MEFGNRFREARKQNGYTQKQIADMLGIEQSNISDWENNITRPEYENLIALAKIYGETLETLLGIEL